MKKSNKELTGKVKAQEMMFADRIEDKKVNLEFVRLLNEKGELVDKVKNLEIEKRQSSEKKEEINLMPSNMFKKDSELENNIKDRQIKLLTI